MSELNTENSYEFSKNIEKKQTNKKLGMISHHNFHPWLSNSNDILDTEMPCVFGVILYVLAKVKNR